MLGGLADLKTQLSIGHCSETRLQISTNPEKVSCVVTLHCAAAASEYAQLVQL